MILMPWMLWWMHIVMVVMLYMVYEANEIRIRFLSVLRLKVFINC